MKTEATDEDSEENMSIGQFIDQNMYLPYEAPENFMKVFHNKFSLSRQHISPVTNYKTHNRGKSVEPLSKALHLEKTAGQTS